jgi:hypothetical protein
MKYAIGGAVLLVVVLVIVCLAALLSVRKVLTLEPAIVFRGA